QPADPEREVERQRPGRDRLDTDRGGFRPHLHDRARAELALDLCQGALKRRIPSLGGLFLFLVHVPAFPSKFERLKLKAGPDRCSPPCKTRVILGKWRLHSISCCLAHGSVCRSCPTSRAWPKLPSRLARRPPGWSTRSQASAARSKPCAEPSRVSTARSAGSVARPGSSRRRRTGWRTRST